MSETAKKDFENAITSLFNVAYGRVIPTDWVNNLGGKPPATVTFAADDLVTFQCSTTGAKLEQKVPLNIDFTSRLLLINEVATKLAGLAKGG